MKVYIYILFCLFFLISCWSWDSSPSATGLIIQENDDFSIPTPSSWEVIPESDLVTPKSWEIALALRSPTPREWYINNIVILKVENTSISAEGIIDSGLQSLEKGIKWYNLISKRDITFADNQTGKIITYTGKYSNDTPEAVYVQSARVCGDNGYYMTISVTEQLEDYERYEFILQNFKCK